MRISDWSSDVCSSDLAPKSPDARRARKQLQEALISSVRLFAGRGWCLGFEYSLADCAWAALFAALPSLGLKLPADAILTRYAERLLARPAVQSALRYNHTRRCPNPRDLT